MTYRLRTAAFAISLFAALPAFAQFASHPAAVTLVARLESLSVSRSPDITASTKDPISITSRWAVAANLTTMRVVAYASGRQSLSAAPVTELLVSPNDVPLPLFTQTVVSNAATSRTDIVPAGSIPRPDSGISGDAPAVVIVAQAL
jgi:hypothetical protein